MDAGRFGSLVGMILSGTVSNPTGKRILSVMYGRGNGNKDDVDKDQEEKSNKSHLDPSIITDNWVWRTIMD